MRLLCLDKDEIFVLAASHVLTLTLRPSTFFSFKVCPTIFLSGGGLRKDLDIVGITSAICCVDVAIEVELAECFLHDLRVLHDADCFLHKTFEHLVSILQLLGK